MKFMVFILDRVEMLEFLLEDLTNAGINGATIIHSSGMAKILSRMDDNFIGASLKLLFDSESDENRTIIAVIKDEELPKIRKVINDVIGDLSKPNTGILFTVPIDFVEGLRI